MRLLRDKIRGHLDYITEIEENGFSIFEVNGNCEHYHTHRWLELAYVKSGTVIHDFEKETRVLTAGDYWIVDYRVGHKYCGEDIAIINCLFMPEIIDATLKNCSGFRDILNSYLVKCRYKGFLVLPTEGVYHDENGKVLELLEKMEEEYVKKPSGYMEMIRCFLIEMFLITLRKTSDIPKENNEGSISGFVTDYIEKNYSRTLSLAEASEMLNYSEPYVSKKFHEQTGMSFSEYLKRFRIEESCRLLGNSDKTIEEIASLVGYDDVKYFRKLFKQYLSVTPKTFRKSLL